MNRRDFNLLGLGLLAGSLPIAIAACRPGTDAVETAADGTAADGFVAVGTAADLDAQGSLANGNLQGNNLAVIRDPGNPDAVIAVSARCTHAGCTVPWDAAQGLFACPCHGGRFNPDGSVAGGPPQRSLDTFEAKIEGDQVLVRLPG